MKLSNLTLNELRQSLIAGVQSGLNSPVAKIREEVLQNLGIEKRHWYLKRASERQQEVNRPIVKDYLHRNVARRFRQNSVSVADHKVNFRKNAKPKVSTRIQSTSPIWRPQSQIPDLPPITKRRVKKPHKKLSQNNRIVKTLDFSVLDDYLDEVDKNNMQGWKNDKEDILRTFQYTGRYTSTQSLDLN